MGINPHIDITEGTILVTVSSKTSLKDSKTSVILQRPRITELYVTLHPLLSNSQWFGEGGENQRKNRNGKKKKIKNDAVLG